MKYWVRYARRFPPLRWSFGRNSCLGAGAAPQPVAISVSQGFFLRPLLSLAAPLPVGRYSRAEYLELELREELPAAVAAAIRPAAAGDRVLGIAGSRGTGALMGLIRYADYLVGELTTKQRAQLGGLAPVSGRIGCG